MSGIDAAQFRRFIVRPTLTSLHVLGHVPFSDFAEDLLIATAAQETGLGHYLHQLGSGPAIGVYQIEPATMLDTVAWLDGRPLLKAELDRVAVPNIAAADQMLWNLRYATTFARINYWRKPEALPAVTTADNLWNYYKRWWNTIAGRATKASFLEALRLTDIDL